MRLISKVITAVVLTGALAGCSSATSSKPSTTGATSTSQTKPATADTQASADFSGALGCSKTTEQKTGELFVKQLFICTRSHDDVKVYTFNDSTSRDNWWKIAEQMGGVLIDKGDTWIAIKNN